MLTGIHRSMERVTSDFRRSCLASSSSVFIVAINTCKTLHCPYQVQRSNGELPTSFGVLMGDQVSSGAPSTVHRVLDVALQ